MYAAAWGVLEFGWGRAYSQRMTDEPDTLVSRYRRRVDETLDRVIDEIGGGKRRAGVVAGRVADLARCFDRVELRLARMARRPDLIGQPA
jgi:hypothetical protein